MRWQFAVNPLHNCSLRPFCDDCSLNSFRTRCIPFLSLYRTSLRVDEIRRNELSRFYFQPPAFPHAIFPIFPVSLGSLFSLFPYLVSSRVSSTSRSLSSSFRLRSRGNSDDIRSRKGLLKPPFCPAFGWKLRETWPECFSRIISSVTFRKIPLGVTRTKLFPLSVLPSFKSTRLASNSLFYYSEKYP